jgi:hypothetical protein
MTIRMNISDRPRLVVFGPMIPGARLVKELEIGSFLTPAFPREWPETLRVVSWNVNRGLQLNGIIEFLQRSSSDPAAGDRCQCAPNPASRHPPGNRASAANELRLRARV